MALSKPKEVQLDLFSCPICSETVKQPKILPCLHSFCKQCIHEHILNMGRNKHSRLTQFSCPVCKSVVKPKNVKATIDEWSAALQNNLILSIMIARNKEDKQQDCGACKRHQQQSMAKFWCKECDETFCEKCNTMHTWMKLSSTHLVVALEELESNTSGIDLHAVSEQCNTHPQNNIELFCFNHEQLCCIQCVSLNHRSCENVKSIEEITGSDDVCDTLHDKLESIKYAAIKLLKEKEQQKSNFKAMTDITEEEATQCLEMVKSSLDRLFETFTKQLHLFRDDENTSSNIRIRLLEQLIASLDHWMSVDRVVRELGTRKQYFIHVDTLKKQLKASVRQIDKAIRNDHLLDLKFVKNEILEHLETAENIGRFDKIEKNDLAGQADDVFKCCKVLGVKLYPEYEDVRVELIETFHINGSDLCCGVCIGNDHIVLGTNSEQLQIVDKKTGTVVTNTTELSGDPRRLCYDKEQNLIFVSCTSSELYKAEIARDTIKEPKLLTFNSDDVGALCKYREDIYVVVDNAIKKFSSTASPDSSEGMTSVVSVNTDCSVNGMNIYRRKIVVTTKNNEIKCLTLQGDEVYCFDDEISKPIESIIVLSSGLTLFVNRANEGSLHILSEDGSRHRRILDKFDSIKKPRDIFLDNDDDETLFVVGGEYMEMYRIKS
ncbi:uncharacterized protein LOC143085186 [Mytilus galloprovincialis]|uniref:uncharacterized protein LOC143085186 n=1 Tax=Mytilus galloprovincialis TaxID=29158 RepID=UPI003F7C5DDF